MDIGEVARRSGLPASTLRFYEEKGLIRSTGRAGLRRLYDPEVLERLSLIALGRAAGFTLDEIMAMFMPGGAPRIDKAVLRAKADQIDGTIRRLMAMRNSLRHAAVCPAPSHLECPSFRKLMQAAVGELRSTRGLHHAVARRNAAIPKTMRQATVRSGIGEPNLDAIPIEGTRFGP